MSFLLNHHINNTLHSYYGDLTQKYHVFVEKKQLTAPYYVFFCKIPKSEEF